MIYRVLIMSRASKTVDVEACSQDEAEATVRQQLIDGLHDDLDGEVRVDAYGVIENGTYASIL